MLITFMSQVILGGQRKWKNENCVCLFSFFSFLVGCLKCFLLCPPALCLSFSISLSLLAHFQAKSKSRTNRFNNWNEEKKKYHKVHRWPWWPHKWWKVRWYTKKKEKNTYVYIHTYAYTRTCISRVSACPEIWFFCDAHLKRHLVPDDSMFYKSVWSYITPQMI